MRTIRGILFALNGMYPGPQAPLPRQFWIRRTPGENPPLPSGGRLTIVLLIVVAAIVLSVLVAILETGLLTRVPGP